MAQDSAPNAAPFAEFPVLPVTITAPVVVFGDLLVDRYWYGTAERVSQEAPVPVVAIERIEDRPGGAANVALNIAALGAPCTLIGVVGDDAAGRELEARLVAAGVVCDFVRAADFATLTKVRIIAQQQQVIRADFEQPVPEAAARIALDRFIACRKQQTPGAVVLEDYDKGTVADPQAIVAACAGVPLVVDPKSKPLAAFAGATVVKPNETEMRGWLSEAAATSAAEQARELQLLRREHALAAIVVTRGAEGMWVADERSADSVFALPARRVDVFDVTGAGDTVAAALAVGLAVGFDVRAAARLANLAGSIAVTRAGTVAVSAPELAALTAAEQRTDRGLLSNAQLLDFAARSRQRGERLVFTNGCFDVLHAGHVAYLEEARRLGDRLVVAVNDDASVARLKGAGRPVNTLDQRAQVLAALAVVDWVVAFAEDTPERLLAELQPEVLVKGGDYTPETVVGHDIVRDYGGEVQVLSLVPGLSTTVLVERIRASEDAD